MQLGIVAVAVGISKFLQVGVEGVHDEVVLILGFGFVAVYGGLAAVGLLGARRPIGPLTLSRLTMVGVTVVLCVVTWSFSWFTPFQLLVVLAVFELVHALVADRLRRATTVGEDSGRSLGAATGPVQH
jgi:hypothetical protein